MSTTRRQPTDEQILREWAQHWPFKRASAQLIRQAQRTSAAGRHAGTVLIPHHAGAGPADNQ